MGRRFKDDTKDWPCQILAYFLKYESEVVKPTMSVLNGMFPKLKLNIEMLYLSGPASYCYEDDGNTPCKGTEFEVAWIVAIGRDTMPREDHHAIRNGSNHCCLEFSADHKVRDSDQKMDRNGGSTAVYIAPYVTDINLKNTCERITYGSYIASINERHLVRLVQVVRSIVVDLEIEKQVLAIKESS